MTYREAYNIGVARLEASLPENPDRKLDARLLLEASCGTDYQTLLADGNERLVTDEEFRRYETMLERRSGHEPVAYILGAQDFMGLPFFVTRDVLIPNQDTENLVEEAMKEVHAGMRILDLCTGSGCILLSLLHYSADTTGVGTDLSAAALRVAAENGGRLGLSDRAVWKQGDLYEALAGAESSLKFDLIVSNPPYIPTAVIGTLMPEVAEMEPRMALDGGEDGLSFYRRILAGARDVLKIGGVLMMETGFDEAADVASMMRQSGFLDLQIIRDYGGQDRIVRGELGL
ncbi:MAG: peptide chain release factor N(5)-glutamine methyltransferase [Lachnospiraceae bacterium]|jgi:release factor glutamine methyltransferase|nr:peptide chain release factor N(5)-glutamine methyltransferase [Lachnospiraceae bacterium]